MEMNSSITVQELADKLIPLARENSWCSETTLAWEHLFPGVPLRDSEGYDLGGYNEQGLDRKGEDHRGFLPGEDSYDYTVRRVEERIAEETEHMKECTECRQYPTYMSNLKEDLEAALKRRAEVRRERGENTTESRETESASQ